MEENPYQSPKSGNQTPLGCMRLWVVSLTFFMSGFACRIVANLYVANVGWSYPIEVHIQWYAFGAGLLTWAAWVIIQAEPESRMMGGWLWVALFIFSFFAILSSVPK